MEDNNTAEYWINKLDLFPHPGLETGYLNEVFRDPHLVTGISGQDRNAGTNIYFLHKAAPPLNEQTVFFRMKNSELLHFYRGRSLDLLFMPNPKSDQIETLKLGPKIEEGEKYFHALPRNRWFVRRLEIEAGENPEDPKIYSLIGCTVVPGYHPEDIETKTLGEIRQELARNV